MTRQSNERSQSKQSKMIDYLIFAAVFLALIAAFIGFALKRSSNHEKFSRLPPSPPRYPLLGNLLQLKKSPHLDITELSKEYGGIFTFWFGRSKPVVILSDQKIVREAFVQGATALSGRPQRYTGSVYTKNFKGVVLRDDNKEWAFQRRLGHQALKTLGEEKFFTESAIHDECKALVDRINRHIVFNNLMDICKYMELSSLNVLCALLFGSRYSEEDPEFHRISLANSWFIEGIKAANIVDGFPILRYLPYRPLKLLRDFVKVRDEILERKLKEHEETFVPGAIRDFTDALIETQRQEQNKMSHTREDSLALMADLFLTGTETTSTALKWAILYLSVWPETQEKAYEALQYFQEEKLRYSDRKNLPYIEALMAEVLRKGSISPLSVPHKATCDTELCGYKLPKGIILMMNLYAMHHDPNQWDEPEQFKPERFIHPEGHFFIPNSSYLPFSVGKRVCLGETLAKRELFLFLCYLIKNFRFDKCENEEVDIEGKFGATLTPKPFRVKVTRRTVEQITIKS